jgi:hypothetical protein
MHEVTCYLLMRDWGFHSYGYEEYCLLGYNAQHKMRPLRAPTSLHPDVLASSATATSPHPTPIPATRSLVLSLSLTHRFPAQHTLTLFPCLFHRPPENIPFQGLINSCSCLLLVLSVFVWEPSGFILSHSEPMGTEVHSPISLLLPTKS